ncbi:YopX family protein [Enterococcus sp. AZ107]|uniref:YopX family protein n=1 Tax=unclassified Enterococcus TaxID=2608891 RepID=UPI003F276A5E
MIPKFRAYVKEVNKTYEITEIDFGDDQLKTELGDWWYFDEVEIMQSTGVKDKNGVEIFEGDVLYYIPFETHINDSIVTFEKGSFFKKKLRNGKLTSVRFIDSEKYEVIGNIYENLELLEESK